ncbi:fused MFS/spermidine synthase, partial [Thermodesulfobacteriota bacterium]
MLKNIYKNISSLVYAFILSCFFLSGIAGLIYQILWVRLIDKVIGSAPFAVATVVAIFMGGLALGSYLAGKTIDKITSKRSLLSLYGKVEIAIGIYGLLIPFFIVLIKPIYVSAYNLLFQYFWVYQTFTFLGCTLLLIIPTTLMGVTLPVLCRFYVVQLDHLGARTGRLYGINTVGAAIGALLCGFLFINKLGMWGTLFIAVAINLIVGILCIILGRGLAPIAVELRDNNSSKKVSLQESDSEAPLLEMAVDPSMTWALCIFTVSGFSAMAYEVIWTRLLGLIIGPTTYSFTLVVSAFIIGLAVGSFIFGWLADRIKGVFSLLVWTQVGAACLALLVSQFFGNSQFFFAKLIYTFQDQFGEMLLAQFLIVFFILLGPTVLLGATFPLVNRIYARSLTVIGKSIGSAYALNTVGAILGSIVAGFVLIPFIGKENGLRLVIALQFTLALLALASYVIRTKRKTRQWVILAGASV